MGLTEFTSVRLVVRLGRNIIPLSNKLTHGLGDSLGQADMAITVGASLALGALVCAVGSFAILGMIFPLKMWPLQLGFASLAVYMILLLTIGIWQCYRCIMAIQTLQLPSESGVDRKVQNAIDTLKKFILLTGVFVFPTFVVYVLVSFDLVNVFSVY
jgi:hypothetical protein